MAPVGNTVVVVVHFVVVVVDIVVVNVVVVTLLVVTDDVQFWSINVNLRLMVATIEFLWWWGGVVCTVIFMPNPTTVLRLCCVAVGVVTILCLCTKGRGQKIKKLNFVLGVPSKKTNSIFKDIVLGGRKVNPISKRLEEMIF